MKNGEVVQKTTSKGIKNGQFVSLPHVTRNKNTYATHVVDETTRKNPELRKLST